MPAEGAAVAAEQSVLGAIIVTRGAAIDSLTIAEPRMFYRPAHRDLAVILLGMVERGQPVDEQTVLAEIISRGLTREFGGGGPYLLTLVQRAWVPDHAAFYAEQVRDAYQIRQAREVAERLGQQLDEITDVEDLPEILALHHDALYDVGELAHRAEPRESPSLIDLLRIPDDYRWLIPGLLERRDRLILTGYEGHGKSMLMREMACCPVAGLHPFEQTPIAGPLRVLVVDSENSDRQNARKYRPIQATLDRAAASIGLPAPDWDLLKIEHRTGMRLVSAADQAELDRLCTNNRPDILVIGPLYKLYAGTNMNEEAAAANLAAFLDTLRARHDVTLLIEAHSGHAIGPHGERSLRPRGSSLFLGWPEFGLGICRSKEDQSGEEHPQIVKVATWRPGRDERDWPKALRRGTGGSLPWVPHTPLDSFPGVRL